MANSVTALLRLPKPRRLEIAAPLWLSVADEEEMPVPAAHRAILDARLASSPAGQSQVISPPELMRRVRAS